MSFLLDALNKKDNNIGSQDSLYAPESKADINYKFPAIVLIVLMSLVLIGLVFYMGFWLAKKTSSQVDRENSPTPVVELNQPNIQIKQKHTGVEAQNADLANQLTLAQLDFSTQQASKDKVRVDDVPAKQVEPNESAKKVSSKTVANQEAGDGSTDGSSDGISQNINLAAANKTSEEVRVDAVDDALLAKFKLAVSETMAMSDEEIKRQPAKRAKVPFLTELSPAYQNQIPALNFQTHIYSTEAKQRWIKVNGRIIREGQAILDGLVVDAIAQQHVVLQFAGQQFMLPALTNW
ncbi:general secretion pathway protein GspB [Catenovulum sediminis]|uniref:general secretion pathway protein GspB n=1 Tax=Catenovulum sediminis TaxID=1740262 RepID=UPI00117D25C5|nr:general secretion pathway protein GspB [Catenovulum sediminis]